MQFSARPVLRRRGTRLLALVVGSLWLCYIVGRYQLGPEYIPPGPIATARWCALAGALAAFGIGRLVFKVRRKRILLLIAALAGATLVRTLANPPSDTAPAGEFLLWMLLTALLYGLPITLILHGLGARDSVAPPLPSVARVPPPPEIPALRMDEERIGGRLREIDAQRQRVNAADAVLAREVDARTRAPIRAKLDHARQALDEQRARHTARLWAIELVRWQHRLAALAGDDDAAHHAARLDALAGVGRDGEAMLRKWSAEGDVAATREGERCIAQLRALLAGCAELRKRIAVRQAMLALRGIEPDEDEHRTAALSTEPLEALQASLGRDGLADALADLEREDARLRNDQAEAREVERILRGLESGGG